MNTLRFRFFLYPAILILVAILAPTPDPGVMLAISTGIIAACEMTFWLGRAIQRRRHGFILACLSVGVILSLSLVAITIRSELQHREQLRTSGQFVMKQRQ